MAGVYEKIKILGSGSFGKAWLAVNIKKKRQVVIKEVRIDSASEKELEQTLSEVKILAKCRHVNIVLYQDAFVQSGLLNIVMEYAENGTVCSQTHSKFKYCIMEVVDAKIEKGHKNR